MFTCPSCGEEPAAGQTTCKCGADLSVLASLDRLPDAWYNRALRAAGDGDAAAALEWMSACCAARPTDAGARCAQGKLWAQLGHWDAAARALAQAQAIDPDAPGSAELAKAIQERQARSAAPAARKDGGRAKKTRKRR